MHEDAAFLRAIREHPDDDAPRLVYADWLDARGDQRGEFIRLQCELDQLPTGDPTRPERRRREKALLAAHHCEWEAPLNRLGAEHVDFHRGLPSRVHMTAGVFLVSGKRLFAT